jgi:centrosomal protein CEP76
MGETRPGSASSAVALASSVGGRDVDGPELSGEQVVGLKGLIDAHLRKTNAYQEIRRFVSEFAGGPAEVLDALKEQHVLEEVIKTLENRVVIGPETPPPQPPAGQQHLLVKVLGGRQFSARSGHRLSLRLHYCGQRFDSRGVAWGGDPAFDASWLVRLSSRFALGAGDRSVQAAGLRRLLAEGADEPEEESDDVLGREERRAARLHQWCPLHLLVLGQAEGDPEAPLELVASHRLEWRRVLGCGGASVALELSGTGASNKMRVPVGLLDVRLELVPALPPALQPAAQGAGVLPTPHDVDAALAREQRFYADAQRRFSEYARAWWAEFVDQDPLFRHRLVKIFAENEWGEHVPSCCFVQPLRAARLLDSPRHAARFVSLLPFVREEQVGGGRVEVWHCAHSFLSRGQGDVEDHALLLCSLLLGFGLRAVVCVGTVRDAPPASGLTSAKQTKQHLHEERDHVWVATLGAHGKAVFWESLTGQHFDPREDPGVYRRIGCMFDHRSLYANKQADDRVGRCSLDVEDDLCWKRMDERLTKPLRRAAPPPLLAPRISEARAAEALETQLRRLVEAERQQAHDVGTRWDDDLAFFLQPALAAYETERTTGVLAGNQEFQAAIKRHIPPAHSFKGFPIVFNHRDALKIMQALRTNAVAKDVLETRADHTHFALRVRVSAYIEDKVAVWVMLAVRARFS